MGTNVKILFDHVQAVTDQVARNAEVAVRKIIKDGEAMAKQRAAVDTGFMKGSIESHSTGEASGELNSPAEYSGYVDEGTVHMAPQPFFTPAVEQMKQAMVDILPHLFDGVQ